MDHNYQMDTGTVSPNRPPQFNVVNCGFRCGWGCCERQGGDDDGGGGGDGATDATPTLISSDDGVGELDESPPHEDSQGPDFAGSNSHALDDGESGSTLIFDDLGESMQFHEQALAHENPFDLSAAGWYSNNSLDDLRDDFNTTSHSNSASDAASVSSVSRNVCYADIGAWDAVDQLPGYFCRSPLRLSPRYEDCRGPPLSHRVAQDYSTLLGPVVYAWGLQRAATGCALFRDTDGIAH
jgi:hypothetical protein